ncbi:hypothetical protein ACFOY8_14775 [Thalassospira xianhensis]|uniref:Uncharacterized protein n=1 Tax=Thalassospira xianhensis MCCC 1A02616 TaxID=1177929 RepID=A0A367UH07_9PROT|nr:hypothetical protein [Thalassospira xianhensis]RCK07587.1 hypothetical protein TH5_00455 [Thalassospira xianhensis MCCC 1A02616]
MDFKLLKEHLADGGRLYLPTDAAKRVRTIAAAVGIFGTLGAGHPVKAAPVQAADDAYVVDVDPAAPATQESLNRIYTGLERAIDAQFPEASGKVAIFNPFNNADDEIERINSRLGIDNGAKLAEEIGQKRIEGYTGGEALPLEVADGSARCLAYGWQYAPERQVTNSTMAYVILHEAVGHCLDAGVFPRYSKDSFSFEGQSSSMKNNEAVAMITGFDWEHRNGYGIDLDGAIAARNQGGTTERVYYRIGDELQIYKDLYADKLAASKPQSQINFSNLRSGLERAFHVRSLSTETTESMRARMFNGLLVSIVDEAFRGANGELDAFGYEKWLGGHAALPVFAKAQHAVRYQLNAEENSETSFPVNLKMGDESFSFERTYAVLHQMSVKAPDDHILATLLSFCARHGGRFERAEFSAGRLSKAEIGAVSQFIERVQSDPEYAARAAAGEITIFARRPNDEGNFTMARPGRQLPGDLSSLPHFRSDAKNALNMGGRANGVIHQALALARALEKQADLRAKPQLEEVLRHLEKVDGGIALSDDEIKEITGVLQSSFGHEAGLSYPVDFIGQLEGALQSAYAPTIGNVASTEFDASQLEDNDAVFDWISGKLSSDMEDGAKIVQFLSVGEKVTVHLQEADGHFSRAVISLKGDVLRYNHDGKLSTLGMARPAISKSTGEVQHVLMLDGVQVNATAEQVQTLFAPQAQENPWH